MAVSLIPNDPEDIVETVREALSPSTYPVTIAPSCGPGLQPPSTSSIGNIDRGISGRLGRYFAMKYAAQLLHPNNNPHASIVQIADVLAGSKRNVCDASSTPET